MNNHYEAVVIGGGIVGLITSLILTQSGYQVLLLEKANWLGGTNNSFKNKLGDLFDYGYHTLDLNRSPFTTKFFGKSLKEHFHSFALRRGIVIQGHMIPYNAPPISEWPDDLTRKIEKKEFADTLEGAATRESLSKIYGKHLTDLAFDEILSSYPTLLWQKKNGKQESELMDQIYPWFFPQSVKKFSSEKEWNKFHYSMREKDEHIVLYPSQGGFGAFIDGITNQIDKSKITIQTGLSMLEVDINQANQKITKIETDRDTFTADRYFWCAPLKIIGNLIGFPFPAAHPQILCLGSYAFREELPFHFHEILVGDKNIPINRISLPGKIGQKKNNLIQVEYSYPVGDLALTEESWKTDCLVYLQRLGLVPEGLPITDYHFLSANKGFISNNDPLKILEDFQRIIQTNTTNIAYPYIGLEVDNINRIIPSVFREVYKTITA